MTNTPPVCNYEGSDYQTSFWDQANRAYEDATEALALRRMLPASGELMLELGAGAGRNTPRYSMYQRVTLVDYSRTQLEQARQRLGGGERYTYVQADIYHLPFVAGLFDGATMIRTLHHMADPRRALAQTRFPLQKNALFILEFANKHNLKALIKYALHQQTWNPYSPEAVEFVPLNYDFHPATIRAWLKENNFAIERQLTVSHLRHGIIKKVMPLRMMVSLDSLFSRTGDLWQLTPSVFVQSHAIGDTEPAAPGTFFRCPTCESAPLMEDERRMMCPSCGASYSCSDDIYDLRPKAR